MEIFKSWFGLGGGSVVVGVVTSLVWVAHYYWHRTRWRRFVRLARWWAGEQLPHVDVDDYSDSEWKSLTALMLFDAGFSPTEILPLTDLAVLTAKGVASMRMTGRRVYEEPGEGPHAKKG